MQQTKQRQQRWRRSNEQLKSEEGASNTLCQREDKRMSEAWHPDHRVLLQKNLWARLGVQRSKSQARNGSFWIRRGSGWRGRDFIGTAAEAKGGVTTALGKQTQIVQRSSHDSLNSPLPLSMFSVIIFQLEHWNRALSTGLCLTWLEWKWKTVVTLSVPHLCLVYFALTICYPPFTSSHWSLIPNGGCQLSGRFHS